MLKIHGIQYPGLIPFMQMSARYGVSLSGDRVVTEPDPKQNRTMRRRQTVSQKR